VTTYPSHRLHFGQPHPRLWLLAAVALAALIGVGAYLLVDHYTGTSAKGISDTQAVTFIQTGAGLPGMNVLNGNPNAHGSPLPANERPYAISIYRSGPYQVKALNLFYAVGATEGHFMTSDQQQAILGQGRLSLMTQGAAKVTHPEWITQYGVTVRQALAAFVGGLLDGAKQ
jgi:hypothetical protein